MKVDLQKIYTKAPDSVDKESLKKETKAILKELAATQNLLYASNQFSILIVLQGLDASGKDGTIRNVFGSINPQGVQVHSFKVPTEKELSHDFLWRIHQVVPAKRMMTIFNRSHYEDVLSPRLNGLIDDKIAHLRMKAINQFESLLSVHNQTIILKFYLHISQEEQIERLNERMENPTKQWKYQPNDWKESKRFKQYQKLYEEIFENCSDIPWHIIPSDQNWYKEYLIAKKVLESLKRLDMKYPSI